MPIDGLSSLAGAYGPIVTVLKTAMFLIPVLAFMIVGAWFFMKQNKFKTDVIILSRRAGQVNKVFRDKGGFFKDKDGKEVFKLRNLKRTIPPPPNECMLLDSKGKNVVFLNQLTQYQLHPAILSVTDVDINGVQLTPVDAEDIAWVLQSIQRVDEFSGIKSMLERYMPLIIIGVTGVIIIVLIYLTIDYVKELLPVARAAISGCSKATTSGAPI